MAITLPQRFGSCPYVLNEYLNITPKYGYNNSIHVTIMIHLTSDAFVNDLFILTIGISSAKGCYGKIGLILMDLAMFVFVRVLERLSFEYLFSTGSISVIRLESILHCPI